MALSLSYAEWNRRLLDFCVKNSVDVDGRFYLNIHEMLEDEGDEAEENFRVTVAQKYASLSSLWSDPISRLSAERDPDGRPLCAAFLGVCVLAAERMTVTGYYAALRKALNQPGQFNLPLLGFVKESFEDAWLLTLGNWLRKQGLYVQPPPADQQRFVRLPKMHALLRAGDLSKLPEFFVHCGYRPASPRAEARLGNDFDRWLGSYQSRITEIGKTAWRDRYRRPGILKQILRVLERWDGSAREFSRGNAVQRCYASLHLDMNPERVLFQARRKPGFPNNFPFAGGTLKAVDEEHYQDLLVPAVFSSQLAQPFDHAVGSHRLSFRGACIFAFVNEGAGMGYDQSEQLLLGENCATLFRTRLADAVRAFLRTITDDDLTRRNLDKSLSGWSVFADFRPTCVRFAPGELAPLGVETKQYPRLSGGLRLGLEQTWLEEAPPVRIEAVGEHDGQATVDGAPLMLQDGRFADISGLNWEAGLHEVIWGERRFVRVVAGCLKDIGGSSLALASDEEIDAALNDTTTSDHTDCAFFLGSLPGQIAASSAAGRFAPQWRLGYDNGLPTVVALSDAIIAPQATRLCSRSQILWSQTVRRFALGRLGAATPKLTSSEARQAWGRYVDRARELHARRNAARNLVDD